MRTAMLAAVVVVLAAACACADVHLGATPVKDPGTPGPSTYDGRIEGDTIEECWVIPSLPFNDAGNNCYFNDDYEEMCPYSSNSPDVVYSYTPPYDMCVSISLCNSYYDTKVFVYEDEVTWGVPYACNDDNFNCVDPPVTYTSWIEEALFLSGHTYYIVVDGYAGYCGDYVLEVEEVYCGPECEIDCVGVPEGEPTCYDGYDDEHNAGCHNDTWSYIEAGHESITICGEGGVFDYNGLTYRDTDWYLIYPCGGVPISITVEAEFEVLFGFVAGVPDCWGPWFVNYAIEDECMPTTITEYLPAGSYAIFVSTATWDTEYECGSEYWLMVEGYTEHCDPTPTENLSWGKVKALYR